LTIKAGELNLMSNPKPDL